MNRSHRYARWLLVALVVVWGLLLLVPVRNFFFRSAIVSTFGGVLGLSLLLVWRKKNWRVLLLAAAGPPVLFLLLPGRLIDKDALRHTYIQTLGRYDGTRYVWGGETWLGVDCSGLLRAALVDACACEAVKQLEWLPKVLNVWQR